MSSYKGNYRQRLFEEYSELQMKVMKLEHFILQDAFTDLPVVDQKDLREQLGHMQKYFKVLSLRVSRSLG